VRGTKGRKERGSRHEWNGEGQQQKKKKKKRKGKRTGRMFVNDSGRYTSPTSTTMVPSAKVLALLSAEGEEGVFFSLSELDFLSSEFEGFLPLSE
jgi:hypothetical protein